MKKGKGKNISIYLDFETLKWLDVCCKEWKMGRSEALQFVLIQSRQWSRAIGGAIGRGIVGAARTVGEASRAYQEGKSGKPRARAKQKPEAEEEESENPGNPGGEKWIQEAVEKPGSYRESVQRRYGKAGFTQEGRNQRISDR